MGRSQQRKGRGGELELVEILNENGIPAMPGAALSYGTQADVVNVAGVHIECKRAEQLRLPEWLAQAERDAQRFGGWPMLFFRRSREPWRVVVPLKAWILFYKSWIGGGGDNGDGDGRAGQAPERREEGASKSPEGKNA